MSRTSHAPIFFTLAIISCVSWSYITGNSATRAFRWAGGIMADLGTLGGSFSIAHGTNGDGSVVVGTTGIAGNTDTHAFRWTGKAAAEDCARLDEHYPGAGRRARVAGDRVTRCQPAGTLMINSARQWPSGAGWKRGDINVSLGPREEDSAQDAERTGTRVVQKEPFRRAQSVICERIEYREYDEMSNPWPTSKGGKDLRRTPWNAVRQLSFPPAAKPRRCNLCGIPLRGASPHGTLL